MAKQSASQSGVQNKNAEPPSEHSEDYLVAVDSGEFPPTLGNDQTVINYYFPVEIVVIGGICEATHLEIQARVWEKLGDALERQA